MLDDSRRSVDYGNGTELGIAKAKCDSDYNEYGDYSSLDWVGAGWYRMMVPAGTRIPETSPGIWHCGTQAPGWLKGSHPAAVGQTSEVKFCFDGKGFPNPATDCEWSTQGKVTHCGDYFVYYLDNTPTCNIRYCATDHF